MRKLKLLLMAFALLGGASSANAQGTWNAPAVPGIDPSTVDGTTTYYLYNVGSDAFVTYGMQWGSMATARRLSSGDQAASGIHKLKASTHNGNLRFHFDDSKYDDRFLSDNGESFNCYVDTWQGANNDNASIDFSYSSGSVSGAYTLTNASTTKKLDVHWLYGGQLTGEGGQGFTDWAIIPESSITDGSYAKYKEKKQMYGVYQALVAAGVVASYTTELETANSVYVNASSTVAQLRTATRTLINAAAEDIASSINGNSLFDDTDMWGNQALSTWTSTAPSNNTGGEYETYNIKYDFNQTHDVPNGLYKVVFHSLFRNDGGGTAPRIIVTDGELDGDGTTASANVPLFTSLSFSPVNTSGASGNIKDGNENRGDYYADWVDNNNVVIPNGRRSSADAMAHTDAVASVDNFKVTKGKMNIRMIIDQNNQWVNFQGFDIIFYGSTTGKLYRDLVELLETSNTLKDQVMNDEVKTALTTAISNYSGLTKSSSEEELEAAIEAVTAANTNASTSIANYTEANTILTAASSLSSASQTIYANNETISAIQSAYTGRTLEALTDDQKTTSSAALAAVKAWDELKAYADALVAVANTNSEANTTLANAISAQNTAATGATTTDAVTTATTTLKSAMVTYVGAADPTSGNRFNLTFMLTNPDLTSFVSWNPAPGWYTDMEGGNSQVMHNDGAASANGDAFYEYWSQTPASNGNFTLYQKVTLPQGTYSMTCDAFSTHQSEEGKVPEPANCAVYFYANETQGSLVSNYPMAEKEISFINESNQEVKIGLKALTGNTYRWMGIGYVKLYKEYTDNTTYDITTNISNADVAVTVDNEPATSAKALKTVTLTVSNFTEGYAVGSVTATYNDGEEKNLDVANPSENVYTYQQPAYDVTVTINVVVDKSALNTAIAAATAARKSANEGAGVFQIPAAAGTALATAIETAQGVYENASATVADVAGAVTAINAAKTTYESTEINEPADGDVFNVMITTSDDYAFKNNPLTFNEDNASGAYFPKNIGVKAYRAQQMIFTKVEGNKYTISTVNANNTPVYIGTNKTINNEGGTNQIRLTTEASKALAVEVVATASEGVYNLLNTEDSNNKLGCQDNPSEKEVGGIYTVGNHNDFTITAATKPSVPIAIGETVKYASRIFPFKPSLPDGVTAYSCESSAGGVLTLVKVDAPAANTPYILYAENGYEGDALTGFGTATVTSYTGGLLTGVYEETTAPNGSYVLANLEVSPGVYEVAFYNFENDDNPTVEENRCYLIAPAAGARALYFPENEATAIDAINALTSGDAQIFNAAGAQLPSLQKGMNILQLSNGKSIKVMVK